MDDTSALEEESFAIVSIYGPSSFYPVQKKSDSTTTKTFAEEDSLSVYTLKVSLEEPDFDFDPTTEECNNSSSNQQQQLHKSNRKELEFRLYFPKGYPELATSAPVHEIVSIYYGTLRLTDSILQEIDRGLEECYVPGEVVVFSWIEWVRTFLEELESRKDLMGSDDKDSNSNNDGEEDELDEEEGEEGEELEKERATSDYWDDNNNSVTTTGSSHGELTSTFASLSTIDNNTTSLRGVLPKVGGIPEFVIRSGAPIVDRKSVFVAHLAPITQASHVPFMIQQLKQENKKVIKATHNIMAFRIENENGIVIQDNDDDGETAAGSRLLHLMSILEVKNVVVVVSRWYGGIPLSADRFKHINNAARQLLDEAGYIKQNDSTSNINNSNSHNSNNSKGKSKGSKKKSGK